MSGDGVNMGELSDIYTEWQQKLDENEWYFSNAFEELLNRLSPAEAYDYIPVVIDELIQLRHSYLIGETLDFLHSVYNRADTTEIHPIVEKEFRNIENVIHQYGDKYSKYAFNELRTILRMK